MEPGTRDQLLWLFYNDALYYAATGDRDAARDSTQRARKFAPLSPELERLELVLSDDSRGPLDITPYLPGASVDPPR